MLESPDKIEAKLANEAFTSKAPPKIVAGLKAQVAKLREEMEAEVRAKP